MSMSQFETGDVLVILKHVLLEAKTIFSFENKLVTLFRNHQSHNSVNGIAWVTYELCILTYPKYQGM